MDWLPDENSLTRIGRAKQEALAKGMDEKSKQFLEEGAAIYHKV